MQSTLNRIGNVGRKIRDWGISKVGSFPGALRTIDRVAQMATTKIPFTGQSALDFLPLDDGQKNTIKGLVGALHIAREGVDAVENKNVIEAGTKGLNLLGRAQGFAKFGQTGFGGKAPGVEVSGW